MCAQGGRCLPFREGDQFAFHGDPSLPINLKRKHRAGKHAYTVSMNPHATSKEPEPHGKRVLESPPNKSMPPNAGNLRTHFCEIYIDAL
jgi:hypothetical protein